MKKVLLSIIMLVFAGSCAHPSGEVNKRIPQARPVNEYYSAIFDNDLERFKSAFSGEAALPPDHVIREYFILFMQFYSDDLALSDLDEFSYSYEGGRSRGSIIISFAGDDSSPVPVVKEGGKWKFAKYSPASTDRSATASRPIPQAEPVIEYIEAIKMDDLDGLKATLVENHGKQISDEEILETMKHMRLDLVDQYGYLYDPRDFEYRYEGSDSKGRIDWIFPYGRSESFEVVKEKNEWKIWN